MYLWHPTYPPRRFWWNDISYTKTSTNFVSNCLCWMVGVSGGFLGCLLVCLQREQHNRKGQHFNEDSAIFFSTSFQEFLPKELFTSSFCSMDGDWGSRVEWDWPIGMSYLTSKSCEDPQPQGQPTECEVSTKSFCFKSNFLLPTGALHAASLQLFNSAFFDSHLKGNLLTQLPRASAGCTHIFFNQFLLLPGC